MFNMIILIFLACFNYGCVYANESVQNEPKPKKFVIVTASYNNIDFVAKYLESVFSQKCDEKKFTFRVIYDDDGSTDGTGEFVEEYKKKFNLGDKLCLIKNEIRVGGHENIYHAVHSCDNDEIVLIVDGDDWLARDDVLEILNKVYSDPNVWITYGQFKKYPSDEIGYCTEIPDDVITTNSFRSHKWISSHLRTFYVWLYKRIKMEDLIFDGEFVPVCGDLAIMFPMLEMAGMHSRFIPEILYIYNCDNQNSYWHNFFEKQKRIEKSRPKKINKYNTRKFKKGLKKSYKLRRPNKNHEMRQSNEIHAIIERHIRQDITPYAPLQESDLVKYN